jgi:hypothetical protein
MIGVGRAARVVGTATVTDAWRTDADTQFAQWASVSKYDPGVNEGAAVYDTKHYYTRFLADTAGTFDFYVQLSGPATGRERIRWSIDGADTDFVEFDQTRVNDSGVLELAPTKGRDQVRFRATIKERNGWFHPRRMVLTLDSADQCELVDGPTTLVLIIYSRKDPPRITLTGGPLTMGVGGTDDCDFNVVDSTGAAYTMANLIDPITVYFRVYQTSDTWKTPLPDVIRIDGDPETDPRDQKVTFTSASPATQNVTFIAYSGSGSYTLEALIERGSLKYAAEQFDADTGIKNLTGYYVHRDENQWCFSNDFARLRQDNYGLYDKDGWHPGYPTGYGFGGHTTTTDAQDFVRFETQSAVTPVTDPITGNSMEWWVNTAQVTAGPSYTRQLFTVQYCGGPWIGHVPPGAGENFVRAAYRFEPFKSEDADHQHEVMSVGYRARQVARSSSVQFRARNVVGANGHGTFGPQDQPYIAWTQNTVGVAGDSITITDYEGTSATFTAGAEYAVGSTADDTAQNIVDAVNGSSLKVIALKAGSTVAVKQGEVNGTHPGVPAYNASGDHTDRLAATGGGFDSRVTFLTSKRFVSTAIVDASGNDCRPTAVGGTTGEYYYDSETGTELWFWSMKNMWGRQLNATVSGILTNSAPERLTHSAWNIWYGVRRDPIWGLTLWMVNYVPDEPAAFNPTLAYDHELVYRYNDGDATNTRSFSAWGYDGTLIDRTPAEPGWLIESTETAYQPLVDDGYDTDDCKGWDFAGHSKCLMVFNPVWVSNFDGSDDIATFNNVKTNSLGNLIHSIQMQIDTEANVAGWPDFFPAQLYNWWSPRGNCTAFDDTRPTIAITV